jgi:hypothetical protein
MPYDTITGGLEQASRLGHSEAAIRTLAERASFYVPAESICVTSPGCGRRSGRRPGCPGRRVRTG